MSRDRGVNTVVDVAFALLAIAVAVVALSTISVSDDEHAEPFEPDHTATVLGTATVDVNYSVGPVLTTAVEGDDELDGGDYQRQRLAHGAMATHVKTAALAKLAVGDRQLTATGRLYESAVDDRLKTALANAQFETNVTAYWEPYPGASVSGTATVGAAVPPDADLHTTTLRVPSGVEQTRKRAIAAVADGRAYAGVAETVAAATVAGYLPPVASKHALERDDSTTVLTRHRYRRFAGTLDGIDRTDVLDEIEESDVETDEANAALAAALAERLVPELRRSFDTPEAAARAVSTGTIRLVVRTWEP